MTVKELAYVVLKVFGLYFLLKGIYLIPLVIQTIMSLGENEGYELFLTAPSFISVGMIVLLGFILLRHTNWVGRKIGLDDFSDFQGSIQIDHFQTIAFSIIGVVFLVYGLTDLARVTAGPLIHTLVKKIILKQGIPYGVERWSSYNTGVLIKSFVQIGVGLYLFLRASGIAMLWQKFQEREKLID